MPGQLSRASCRMQNDASFSVVCCGFFCAVLCIFTLWARRFTELKEFDRLEKGGVSHATLLRKVTSELQGSVVGSDFNKCIQVYTQIVVSRGRKIVSKHQLIKAECWLLDCRVPRLFTVAWIFRAALLVTLVDHVPGCLRLNDKRCRVTFTSSYCCSCAIQISLLYVLIHFYRPSKQYLAILWKAVVWLIRGSLL